MLTLFKSKATTKYGFRCRQTSTRSSQKTEIHFNRIKRSRLSVVIGRFRSILFIFVFQGSLAVAIIRIDGSEMYFVVAVDSSRVRMFLKIAIKLNNI